MAKFAPLNLSRDEIIAFTPQWKGERSDDGRPRVSDELIERLKAVSLTQAWGVLIEAGYRMQYEGGWDRIHPEQTLCGRALTATFMPKRADLAEVIFAKAEEEGQVGDITSWPIYALQKGDVYVADVFGKIEWGPVIGDNLATAIHSRTGTGTVQHAAVRDIDGIEEVGDFPSFHRGIHPTYANPTVSMMGINCPVRINGITVMPGDVILGKRDGLLVIPPQLAEQVAVTCELTEVRDIFGKQRLREGRYLPGHIDRKWTEDIEEDFLSWCDEHPGLLKIPKEDVQNYLKKRTW